MKKVSTLDYLEKPPREFEINFEATGLTSGIYFDTLSSGKFTQTKK